MMASTEPVSRLSTSRLAAIASALKDGHDFDQKMAMAADQAAVAHLYVGYPIMMSGDHDIHYPTFTRIAEAIDRERIIEGDAALEALGAGDAAVVRWAPDITAAYYFGLALGLRLNEGLR